MINRFGGQIPGGESRQVDVMLRVVRAVGQHILQKLCQGGGSQQLLSGDVHASSRLVCQISNHPEVTGSPMSLFVIVGEK